MNQVTDFPCVWVIVPAAGIGQRMAAATPKQYLPLGNMSVIEHTVERLLEVNNVKAVIVALNTHDTQWSTLPIAKHPLIETVIGGDERADSVLAALNSLHERAAPDDWVLVHDAARPCILAQSVEHLISGVQDYAAGGILGVPVSDTLKNVNAKSITDTIDRRRVWQAQTPQIFPYRLLTHALTHALQQHQPVTDEASAVEYLGLQPRVVLGRRDNIKITLPEDLVLAEMIIERQNKDN